MDQVRAEVLGGGGMARASTSHGSHVIYEPRSLAPKNPARCSLPPRVMYRMVPIPGSRTAPSVTIHNWSSGLGREMSRAVERATCALWNDVCRSSVYWIDSLDSRQAMVLSSGEWNNEHPGMTRASTLKAPMNYLI